MHPRFLELIDICMEKKATDIHFHFKDNQLSIFVRTILGLIEVPTVDEDKIVFEQLKYEANLDISNQSLPQSGSFTYNIKGTIVYFRLAVLHTFQSTSGVLRLLNIITIENVFHYQPNACKQFTRLLNKKSGLIFLSGPTGSGKTTTLYSLLQAIHGKKIYSIEDPIEMILGNVVQLQVNMQKGLTYSEGIKQLMRHDPDLIVIGEIRDEKEAKMAIRAALTGHLVLSTIHAKDCIGVLQRLNDFMIPTYEIEETVLAICNQRLLTHKNKKERVSIYEIMDEADIQTYLTNKELPATFQSLSKIVKKLQEKNILSKKETI